MKYQHYFLGVALLLSLTGCDVNVTENPVAQNNQNTAVLEDASSQEAGSSSKAITLDNGRALARESMRLLDSGFRVPEVSSTQDGAGISSTNGTPRGAIADGATRTYRFDKFSSIRNGESIVLNGEYQVTENAGVTTLKGNNLKITDASGETALSAFEVVTDRNGSEPTRIAALNADFPYLNKQVSIHVDPAFSGSDSLCPIDGNMKIRANDGSYVVIIAVPGGNLLLDINGEYITLSCGELREDDSGTSSSNSDSPTSTDDGSSSGSSSSSTSPSGDTPPAGSSASGETTPPGDSSAETPSTGTDSSAPDAPTTGSPDMNHYLNVYLNAPNRYCCHHKCQH